MQSTQDARPAGRRLQLSLPHSFAFNYTETGPKTPEPREPHQEEHTLQPPQPPKVRIRRRRPFTTAPIAPIETTTSEQIPLPTIQLPELSSDFGPVLSLGSELEEGLLAPTSGTARSLKRYGRILSPPKTPLDQIFNTFDAAFGSSQPPVLTPQQGFTTIPESPGTFSDSEDSDSSSDSNPSWEDDDCCSPDSDAPALYMPRENSKLSSPMSFQPHHQGMYRTAKPRDRQKWTSEMDDHLWMTYMAYLADPTVTPFKMLPGTAPPLGVCHRVARDAKKTWKGYTRSPQLSPNDTQSSPEYMSLDSSMQQESSAPPAEPGFQNGFLMPRPQPALRAHSANDIRKTVSKWPRSESSTRRRLRHLCKRKPTLAAHYHRLMQIRTPSPFESSSSDKGPSSNRFASPPRSEIDSFSTRDMTIELATSTAPSMQLDAPLAQLTQDVIPKPRPYSTEFARPVARAGAHHRSQSLQLGLGLSRQIDPATFRQLASPFQEPTGQDADWIPPPPASRPTSYMEPVREDMEEGAPIKIHAPRPLSGSMKRRAEVDLGEDLIASEPERRASIIHNLFRTSVDEGDSRFRGRGFSLGAVRNSMGNRHLSDIFTPPSIAEQPEPPTSYGQPAAPVEPELTQQMNTYKLAPPPHLANITRLGSPFAPTPNARLSKTFPRTAFPSGLNSIATTNFAQQGSSPGQSHRQQHTMSWDGTQSPHTRFH